MLNDKLKIEIAKQVGNYVADLNDICERKFSSIKNYLKDKDIGRYALEFNFKNRKNMIKSLVDSAITRSKENAFHKFHESIHAFVIKEIHEDDYKKSKFEKVDFCYFDSINNKLTISQNKTSPKFGNSSSLSSMERILSDKNPEMKQLIEDYGQENIVFLNGVANGKDNHKVGSYEKKCGKTFWEYISGDPEFQAKIISALAEANEAYTELFNPINDFIIDRLTNEFEQLYCENNEINWLKINQEFNG